MEMLQNIALFLKCKGFSKVTPPDKTIWNFGLINLALKFVLKQSKAFKTKRYLCFYSKNEY